MLGLPILLNIDDIDQPYPSEIDDEYITDLGIVPPPSKTPSFFEAFNAQTSLMELLGKIARHLYSLHGQGPMIPSGDNSVPAYAISYARIREIEADLQIWSERLPEMWRPSSDGPFEVVRVRLLLRFANAHVQLLLYRPFLHYVSPRFIRSNVVDKLLHECAAAAISVSRNVVHIGVDIRKQRMLSGPWWFMLYTEFFAVISLVFYVLENPNEPGSAEVLADAHAGRQMIADLADKSILANVVTKALEPFFDQLSERLDQVCSCLMPAQKRSEPAAQSEYSEPPQCPGANSGMVPEASDFLRHRASDDEGICSTTSTARGPVESMAQKSSFKSSFAASMHDILPISPSS